MWVQYLPIAIAITSVTTPVKVDLGTTAVNRHTQDFKIFA